MRAIIFSIFAGLAFSGVSFGAESKGEVKVSPAAVPRRESVDPYLPSKGKWEMKRAKDLKSGGKYYIQAENGKFLSYHAEKHLGLHHHVQAVEAKAKTAFTLTEGEGEAKAKFWYIKAAGHWGPLPIEHFLCALHHHHKFPGEEVPGVAMVTEATLGVQFHVKKYDGEWFSFKSSYGTFLSADRRVLVPGLGSSYLVNMRPEDGGWERFRVYPVHTAAEAKAAIPGLLDHYMTSLAYGESPEELAMFREEILERLPFLSDKAFKKFLMQAAFKKFVEKNAPAI